MQISREAREKIIALIDEEEANTIDGSAAE
jgi:hypothetical protein